MPHPRLWAVNGSRDDQIENSPARGHVAKWREHKGSYRCVAPRCDAATTAGLFCDFHLWTIDNPALQGDVAFQQ